MRFDILHPADQLVMIMERLYGYGMTTTSGGNLSIRDDNGDIWITPGGVDKGTLTRKDIVQVKPDGSMVGIHKPSVELPFHTLVYKKRSDIKAVLHAHPPALIAFSMVRKIPSINLIPNVQDVCGKIGMAEYDLPGSNRLGEKIAKLFEKGNTTVMLENHGVVVGHESLFHAFMAFETLDFCARLEITAKQIGTPVELTQKYLMISKSKQHVNLNEFIPHGFSSEERNARREMCELIHRAYDQRLFTSTQGTFSQRLDEKSFIITPYMVDRKYISPDDIVRIESGWKQIGKTPSRSVVMHQCIYEKHPDINSVIIAHPSNIMAYVVTKEEFDSRTIPESYIMLRNVKKLPFGSNFMQPILVAEAFSRENPVILIENDCIVATGNSLLNAFDRLEVAEFSAKALIASRAIGEVVLIDKKQIDELEVAFHLKSRVDKNA
ncbi:MAG: class II aldolase/adducin family protein [Clostridia bacterium]